MNYKVFARKWRPKKFEDIVGQQYVIRAITQSFKLNKVHHAYIFSGDRGIGKTTIARLLAKALNCKHEIYYICDSCQNCIDINSGCFSDFIEIDAASRTKVEDTYEFLDSIQYTPIQGIYKIYLIDEVHMLSKHSFNALLKTLEEPPEHIKFILVTTEHYKIPKTILSRCLHFYLRPLNISQITSKLESICKKEKIKTDINSLELLACSAKGSMRDALNLLEQAVLLSDDGIVTNNVINDMLGLLNREESLSLVENLTDGNINDIMNQIENYFILGVNWDFLFEEILTIYQKIAMHQFASYSLFKKESINKTNNFEKRIHELSTRITPEDIQLYYQIFLLGRRELPYSPNHRMGMEMTILRALAFSPKNIYSNNDKHNIDFMIKNDEMNINKSSADKERYNLNLYSDNSNAVNIKNQNTTSCNSENNNDNSRSLNHENHDFHDTSQSMLNHSNKIMSSNNITEKILKVRSKLLDHKKDFNDQLSNNTANLEIDEISQKKSKSILLKRFADINVNISENNKKKQ